jgi:hypothetical protein
MKYLIIAIILILSINVSAQNEVVDANIFIRIYNLQGKKIEKGKIKSISNTSIELYSKGKTIEVPLSKIGIIKTKRSAGNNVAKGALIGGVSLAVLGYSDGDDNSGLALFSATDKAAFGLVGGGILGAAIGGVTSIFKKSKLYIIDGNEMKLKDFKEAMLLERMTKAKKNTEI